MTAVLIVVAGLGLQQANAVTTDFTSTLTVPNSSSLGTGPFGTVDVMLLSSTIAQITFTANTAGGFFFIDGGAAAVQLSAAATPTFVSESISDFKSFTSGNEDGFGTFTIRLNDKSASVQESVIVFDVTINSGTWASADSVLAFNSKGFDAGAHIIATLATNTPTGFVGEGTTGAHVPDGGTTAMLLGAGLSALGLVRRFVKR